MGYDPNESAGSTSTYTPSSGGGGYDPNTSSSTPASSKSTGKKHGLLHSIERYSGAEFAGNLAKDVGTSLVGLPTGLIALGEASEAANPLSPAHFGHSDTKKAVALAKGLVHGYEDYYGHDLLHHLYKHPLQPILDVGTVLSGGAGAAAKAGSALSKAGLIADDSRLATLGERAALKTRSPRAVQTGEKKGPVVEDISSTKPLVKGREQLGEALRKNRSDSKRGIVQKFAARYPGGVGPVGSEFKRFGKDVLQGATQEALSHMQGYEQFQRNARRISPKQWAALHIRALDVAPEDIIESGIWDNTANGELLKDPQIRQWVENPGETRQAKKLTRAEDAARSLSQQGEELMKVDPEVAAARPELFKRMVSELLGRPAKEITGDPYYFPHVADEVRAPNPIAASGGGKGIPRKLGSMKQNLGRLALSGRLDLARDVLGPEFLRRVQFTKHGAIHEGLVKGAAQISRAEIEDIYGGKLPRGYEYVRDKSSMKIPHSIRGEGSGSLADLIPDPGALDSSTLAEGFTTPDITKATVAGKRQLVEFARKRYDKLSRQHEEGLKQIADARLGKIDPVEAMRRGKESAKAKRQAAGVTRSGKRSGASGRKAVDKPLAAERRAVAQEEVDNFVRENPDHPVAKLWQDRTEHLAQLEDALNPMPGDPIDMERLNQLVGHLAGEAKRKERYYIVPKSMAHAATGEFTRSNTFMRRFVNNPLSVWRALVLGTRVGFLTNNVVGNMLMYAVRTGGRGAIRDLFMAIMESHGRETALKLLRNQATPPGVRTDLMKEFFPEQFHGFGRTASPATSTIQRVAGAPVRAGRAATGAIPRVTQKVAENLPRRALVRNMIRNSPEFKAAYSSLPRETRSFEEAARTILEGKGGKAYQRRISKDVNAALGNYLNLSPFERNVMRNALPFYSWYRAIVTVTAHMAADTPGRAALLGTIGRIGADQSAATDANLPSFLRGGVPIGQGRDGTDRLLATGGLNPYATLEQLRRGSTEDLTSLGLSPFIMAPLEAYAHARQNYQPVPPLSLLTGALGSQIGLNLPPTQLVHPKKPSELYPTRDRWTQLFANLGLPVKEYNPNVAKAWAEQGR